MPVGMNAHAAAVQASVTCSGESVVATSTSVTGLAQQRIAHRTARHARLAARVRDGRRRRAAGWAPSATGTGEGGKLAHGALVHQRIEIADHAGRRTPDVAPLPGHRIVIASPALPVARMALMVLRVHQEGERHLEDVRHLARHAGVTVKPGRTMPTTGTTR